MGVRQQSGEQVIFECYDSGVCFMRKLLKPFIINLFLCLMIIMMPSCFRSSDVHKMENLELLEKRVANFDEDCLVVFDVDETIITPVDSIFHMNLLRNKFWRSFYYIMMTGDVFFRNVVEHYENGLFTAKYALVDPNIPDFIKALQSKGVKVIALTSCPTGEHKQIGKIEDWRVWHLLSFGIDFRKSFPEQADLLFTDFSQTHAPLFKDGILFANRYTKKGPLLVAFLEKVGWRPREIVFIDDSAGSVRSVEESMKKINIKCTGLQYLAADRFSKDMDRVSIKLKVQSLIEKGRWVPGLGGSPSF